MDPCASIDADSLRIAEVASAIGGSVHVPSCPQWCVIDLVRHLGEVHEFWAHTIEAANPTAPWQGDREVAPQDLDAAVVWMRGQTRRLIAAMRIHDLQSPCWTWWGEPLTAGAVRRHQVQEAALHRWDVEAVLDSGAAIPLDLAVDGIPEWIEVRLPWMTDLPRPLVEFRAVDVEASWLLPSNNPLDTQRVTVMGSASDLVLFLNGRRPLDGLRVTGDATALEPLMSQMSSLNG